MWQDIVRILSGLSGMTFMPKVGDKYAAYRQDDAIVLEVPEEPETPPLTAVAILGFGRLLEPVLSEPGFAARWEKRMLPYCVEIVDNV